MNIKRTSSQGFGLVELLIGIVVLLLIVGAGLLFYKHHHKANPAVSVNESYQNAISKFVTAMENGNTTTVASLETARFKNWIETSTTAEKNTKGEHGAVVTNNFYVLAKHDEELNLFSEQSIAGAHIATGSYQGGLYMPPKGTTGQSETYSTKTNSTGTASYSPAFTIDVVRTGNTWHVDNVGFYATATTTK